MAYRGHFTAPMPASNTIVTTEPCHIFGFDTYRSQRAPVYGHTSGIYTPAFQPMAMAQEWCRQSLVPWEHTTLPWGNPLYSQEPYGILLTILLLHDRLHGDRGPLPPAMSGNMGLFSMNSQYFLIPTLLAPSSRRFLHKRCN